MNGADLSLEVSGIVDQIAFNSGDDVAAGTVLLRLRSEDDAASCRRCRRPRISRRSPTTAM